MGENKSYISKLFDNAMSSNKERMTSELINFLLLNFPEKLDNLTDSIDKIDLENDDPFGFKYLPEYHEHFDYDDIEYNIKISKYYVDYKFSSKDRYFRSIKELHYYIPKVFTDIYIIYGLHRILIMDHRKIKNKIIKEEESKITHVGELDKKIKQLQLGVNQMTNIYDKLRSNVNELKKLEKNEIIEKLKNKEIDIDGSSETYLCKICYDETVKVVLKNCGHTMCNDCIGNINNECPFCKRLVDKNYDIIKMFNL